MLRLFSILSAITFSSAILFAQQIKQIDATADDYIELLKHNGYEAYAFDISTLSDQRYRIKLVVKEYTDGVETSGNILPFEYSMDNMTMLSDFDEESQKSIAREEMYDPERGIYRLAKKLTIGYTPTQTDSLKVASIHIDEMGTSFFRLPLKSQTVPETGSRFCSYMTRPFTLGQFSVNEFIPLTLIGSSWYDERAHLFRFCGSTEIDPAMSDEIISHISHFYVIGVTITPYNQE